MSIHLHTERDRLLTEVQAIKDTGKVAPAECWIDSYLAKNQRGQAYEYYKLVAKEPIFTGAKGGRTKTVHLGKTGSDRYNAAVLSIRRRNAIEKLESQVARLDELIELDNTLPSVDEFR